MTLMYLSQNYSNLPSLINSVPTQRFILAKEKTLKKLIPHLRPSSKDMALSVFQKSQTETGLTWGSDEILSQSSHVVCERKKTASMHCADQSVPNETTRSGSRRGFASQQQTAEADANQRQLSRQLPAAIADSISAWRRQATWPVSTLSLIHIWRCRRRG